MARGKVHETTSRRTIWNWMKIEVLGFRFTSSLSLVQSPSWKCQGVTLRNVKENWKTCLSWVCRLSRFAGTVRCDCALFGAQTQKTLDNHGELRATAYRAGENGFWKGIESVLWADLKTTATISPDKNVNCYLTWKLVYAMRHTLALAVARQWLGEKRRPFRYTSVRRERRRSSEYYFVRHPLPR